MVSLFGYQLVRKKDEDLKSFVNKEEDDGATSVQASGGAGAITQYTDVDGNAKTEAELISRYRQIALQPEVEYAIDEIVNEAVASDENEVVTINLDNVEENLLGEKTKKIVTEEFKNIINILNFNNVAYEIFRRWVIDGRMYYHVVINEKNPAEGIQELRYIDPRKIKKIREFKNVKTENNLIVKQDVNEYFMYNETGFNEKKSIVNSNYGSMKGLRIANDSIIHCTSGLMDENNKIVYSYLHKALRPMNMLRSLEDATIIYHLSRAPERRVFYVDVGNLPKAKAEQHLNEVMTRFKNKLVYDQSTGMIKDDRKHMTMLEDFYLARRDGSKGTEISTLGGGQTLQNQLESLEYFLKKLYKALNIPTSRLEDSSGFSIGRSSEITRDEVKFAKFIARLRKRFSMVFLAALEKQLVLKGILTIEEWEEVKNQISFDFKIDNHFSELKQMDIMMSRMDVLERVDNFTGKYFSKEWIRKNVLYQSEEEIEEMDEEMDEEMEKEDAAMPPQEALPPPPEEQEKKPTKPPEQVLKIKHEIPSSNK